MSHSVTLTVFFWGDWPWLAQKYGDGKWAVKMPIGAVICPASPSSLWSQWPIPGGYEQGSAICGKPWVSTKCRAWIVIVPCGITIKHGNRKKTSDTFVIFCNSAIFPARNLHRLAIAGSPSHVWFPVRKTGSVDPNVLLACPTCPILPLCLKQRTYRWWVVWAPSPKYEC